MNRFQNEKINKHLNILTAAVFVAIAVFSINMALVTDPLYFLMFLVAASPASAWLFTVKGGVIGLLCAVIGWGISLLVTKSAVCGLLAISYLPYSFTYFLVYKRKLSRSTAIGISSAVITVASTAVLLLMTYYRVSEISLPAIVEAFPYFFSKLKYILCTSFYVEVAGSSVSLIAESNVDSYLYTIIGTIPALISACATLVGFITGWLYKKALAISYYKAPEESKWHLLPSIISTVFLLLGILLCSILRNGGVFSLTALNITIILLPGIFIAGLLSAFSPIIQNGIRRPRILRPFLLIISLFNNAVFFITACVFFGVYDSFKSAFPKRRTDKKD